MRKMAKKARNSDFEIGIKNAAPQIFAGLHCFCGCKPYFLLVVFFAVVVFFFDEKCTVFVAVVLAELVLVPANSASGW